MKPRLLYKSTACSYRPPPFTHNPYHLASVVSTSLHRVHIRGNSSPSPIFLLSKTSFSLSLLSYVVMRISVRAIASLVLIALAAVSNAEEEHHRKHHKHHKKHHHHEAANTSVEPRGSGSNGHALGLPWGCDPSCINGVKSTKNTDFRWYHHWQDTRVADLDKLGFEYVATFWGPTKWDKWNAVKAELSRGPLPKYMLAFNEPDVQGQSDLGPKAAAKLWMKEMQPWANKGVKVGSPQVCWNMQWLEQFMGECKKLGCKISFIALHWYGSWREFDKFTHWIESVHNEFGLDIWITEYGITQAVVDRRRTSRTSTSARSSGCVNRAT